MLESTGEKPAVTVYRQWYPEIFTMLVYSY